MKDITDKEFALIREHIRDNYGIKLGDEKKSLVYSRLRSILSELQMENFTEYFNYLIADKSGEAAMRFIDKITTNHTFFMREVEHFYYLRDYVFPYLEENVKDRDLRVWCAGCSSGEEAYTLEILLHEYFGKKPEKWNTELLATDISSNVLTKAVKGVYSNEQIKPLDKEWKSKYFKPYGSENMIISDEIKRLITFRKFNLMEDRFPFKKPFHVIFCRNVMIYFDNETRDNLVSKYYDAMLDGGYLFIGHSESLNHTATKFKYLKPALYRKM